MKQPPLEIENITADMARDRLDYDPQTGILRWKISPSNNWPAGSIAGSRHRSGYITIKLLRRCCQAHRLAWLIVHGKWPTNLIDHIDGDGMNNALSNLREATASQNQGNRVARGYYYSTTHNVYYAMIRINGEKVYVGMFDTAEKASAAYLAAHIKYHGEFSFTQRPAGGQTLTYATHLSTPSSPGAQ